MVAATDTSGIVVVGVGSDIAAVDDEIAAYFVVVAADGCVVTAAAMAVDGTHVIAVALGVDGQRAAVLNIDAL